MGKKLFYEDFLLKNVLGKGSFGSVFKSDYIKEKKKVAVKKIRDEDRFRKAALKEIEILEYLSDFDYEIPFVKYFGEFKENNIQYIVFELLDINLYDFYKRFYYQIDYNFLYDFTFSICLGLVFLHKKYIHADLKPENIMYDRKTKIFKIIDLGSSFNKDKDYIKPYIQSRYYRAPEILFGTEFNEKIDIWSLGCIIIELITSKPIFNGKNIRDMIFKISEFLDIPKLYKNETFFNLYFCQKISDNLDDSENSEKNDDIENSENNDDIENSENSNELEYYYLHNNFTKNKKYKKPEIRITEYLNNYMLFVSGDLNKKKELQNLIIDMLKYNINERPSAEKCLEYKLFQ